MKKFLEQDIARIAERLGILAVRFEGKTVLITGAAGFVGGYMLGLFQYLNRHVLKRPMTVIAIDNYLTGTKDNPFYDKDDEHLEFVEHDITKPYHTNRPVDFIIHCRGNARA